MIRVLLVTSDREQCGIREYGRMLIRHMPEGVEVVERPYPHAFMDSLPFLPPGGPVQIIHVNHHAALHSSWTPDHVRSLQQIGHKVVITQHDTFETSKIMQERGLPAWIGADAWITHERVDGLPYGSDKVIYLPQGVLGPATGGPIADWENDGRPTLGVFGFDFPWKNFDMVARLTSAAGWRLTVLSAGMSDERMVELSFLNPRSVFVRDYVPSEKVVDYLAGCQATAFLYQNGNSGTSGAIRLGLAARKPIVAFKCRQFRDLYDFPGVWWAQGEDDVLEFLQQVQDSDASLSMTGDIQHIAEELSWRSRAEAYAGIYRKLARGKGEEG